MDLEGGGKEGGIQATPLKLWGCDLGMKLQLPAIDYCYLQSSYVGRSGKPGNKKTVEHLHFFTTTIAIHG